MASMPAQADPFVLDNGRITIGIDEYGGLGGGGVGLIGPGGDAVMRGCLCEGWGASADSVSAYTYGGVTNNIRSANAVSNLPGFPLYGRSLATLENGLEVSHAYTSVADGRLFRVQVTLWNVELQTLRDVRYARTLDLDVAPGFFDDNYTTIYGGSPNGPAGPVLSTSANPVGVPDPMVLRPEFQNVNLTDRGGDLGSYFVLSFGDLGRSESISFDMYIGATDSVSELMDAFKSVGIEAFTYTTGNLTGDDMHPAPAFGYGFAGLGLPAWSPNEVPEPASIALLAAGAAGMALGRRRGSRAVVFPSVSALAMVWYVMCFAVPIYWLPKIGGTAKLIVLAVSAFLLIGNGLEGLREFKRQWQKNKPDVMRHYDKRLYVLDWHKVAKSLYLSVGIYVPGVSKDIAVLLSVPIFLSMMLGFSFMKVYPVASVFAWGIPFIMISACFTQFVTMGVAQVFKVIEIEKELGVKILPKLG